MSISDDTISVDVFNDVRTAIVSASPIVTNSTTSKTKTATVLAAYNDKATTTPQIVINPAAIDESEWRFGSFQGKKIINVSVECYYSNTLGVDQLSDTVMKAIRETAFDGMELIAVTSDYAFTNPNEMKFHLKTITFTFERE